MKLYPVTKHGISTDPFDMLTTFDTMFDSFFNYPTSRTRTKTKIGTVPRANVVKSDTGFTIEMAAPGFSRDEFNIDVQNHTLTVSVTSEDTPDYEDSLQTREYSYSNFSRSWTMPKDANVDAISARYEAGILFVEVPVEGRKETKRTITVE